MPLRTASLLAPLALLVLLTLVPTTAHAQEEPPENDYDYGRYAVRGNAFSAGFLLGRGRADVFEADSFARNWFTVNLGFPVVEAAPFTLFSIEYSFQVALDVDEGTGLRPVIFNGEFEYFMPLDPEAQAEFSLFGSIGLGWQFFDFDFEGTRNFLLSLIHFGGRFYFAAGVYFQLGFSYQRATGLSSDTFDFDYWNFSFLLGARLS